SAARVYHTTVQDVVISNPGTTAFVLGDAGGYSADNRIIRLQLQGRVRDGFRAQPGVALVSLAGEYTFENGWIEQPVDARLLPLSISGSATVRGLWLEYPAENVPDGNVILFKDVRRADVDRLL